MYGSALEAHLGNLIGQQAAPGGITAYAETAPAVVAPAIAPASGPSFLPQ